MSSRMQSNGIFAVFTNLKVKIKVMLGFAAVLALLVVVTVVSISGLSTLNRNFDSYARVSSNALSITNVDREFVGMRRNSYVFLATGEEREAARFRDLVASTRKAIEESIPTYSSEERKAAAREIGGLINDFATVFYKAVQLRATRGSWSATR